MRDSPVASIDHDAKPGALARCQICGSSHLRQIIDLGHQPPCDALLTRKQLNEPEITYPLRLNQCEECTLAQLDYVVPRDKVYPLTYPYRAGISWPVVQAHREMARSLVKRFGSGLCVDIGCNDGVLLAELNAVGCDVFGVEPTNIADHSRERGIPTAQSFFNEQLARGIAKQAGQANIIAMTNVFAHMGDLGEVMRGACALLAKDGVLVIENHYLLDVLERNQFDTIYHEHIRTYTLRSMMVLFEQYGMEVFDVERVPRYCGNIRAFVGWRGKRTVCASVGGLLAVEVGSGVGDAGRWSAFRSAVYTERSHFMELCHRRIGQIAGCSAPGRASTLLNFYGVTPDILPWTGEIIGSLKIGKYIPGCHVPIVSNERIAREAPDYLVLLAWHYAGEIIERLRKEGVRSVFVKPLPTLELTR